MQEGRKYSFYRIATILAITINSFSIPSLYSQNHGNQIDSIVVSALKTSNYESIDSIITLNGVDYPFLDSTQTMLSYSILLDNIQLVKYLLGKGADINRLTGNYTPLMLCAMNNRVGIASFLLKNFAEVDKVNSHRNTALILAARYGNLDIVKILVRHWANPFFTNFTAQNAFDYAERYGKKEVVEFLTNYMTDYSRRVMPSVHDGPYVEYVNSKKIKVFYLVNDSIKRKTFTKSKRFRLQGESFSFTGFWKDTANYRIPGPDHFRQPPFTYNGVNKVFVVGDVHGQFDNTLTLLIGNKIINPDLSWCWGTGHLVFIGDIFDRGDKVTEMLWFIYRLSDDAKRQGGQVHLLLGNHEFMILNGDTRFVNKKYLYLASSLSLSYKDFFGPGTVLGKWLRSRNAAIIIDSIAFVHAGVSVEFVKNNYSIKRLNDVVYRSLNERVDSNDSLIKDIEFISGEKGPLWYRGYLGESIIIPRIQQVQVDSVLRHLNVKRMVIGHTEVKSIVPIYWNRVVPVNVPFNNLGVRVQGLRIEGGKFYRCYVDGTCEPIVE
jgi:hypothetical protein